MVKPDSKVVVSAFSEDHVERLTGVSKRQLRYWDRTGFFVPSLAEDDRRFPYSRLYTFRDLICLQVLNALRNDARVSLPHLREVKKKLAHLGDDVWARTTLYVLKRKVIFDNPDSERREEVVSGQGVLKIPLEIVRANMRENVNQLWRRDPLQIGRIDRRKGVAHNRAVLAGTRIPVASIRAFVDEGYNVEQILAEYPTLTEADVRAAMEYGQAA
ncbi:DUF433 domain-containing protein [Consotaella aegiceratis]|uniref:DUF433 domain-containing protein n=1 Tax=Consotaella aegiceratis TaxID=3097961 RepID=UPI002F40893F